MNSFYGVSNTFCPLLITDKLSIATENLSLILAVRIPLNLVCKIVIVQRLYLRRIRNPMLLELGPFVFQKTLLFFQPVGAFGLCSSPSRRRRWGRVCPCRWARLRAQLRVQP